MKIDHEIMKTILETFRHSDKFAIDQNTILGEFDTLQHDIVLFNLQLLADQNLVIRTDLKPGIGLQHFPDGDNVLCICLLRITAEGFEYLEALEEPKVFETLKKKFSTASLSTAILVGKTMLTEVIKQKLTNI